MSFAFSLFVNRSVFGFISRNAPSTASVLSFNSTSLLARCSRNRSKVSDAALLSFNAFSISFTGVFGGLGHFLRLLGLLRLFRRLGLLAFHLGLGRLLGGFLVRVLLPL